MKMGSSPKQNTYEGGSIREKEKRGECIDRKIA